MQTPAELVGKIIGWFSKELVDITIRVVRINSIVRYF